MSKSRESGPTQSSDAGAARHVDELSDSELERVLGGLARPWDAEQTRRDMHGVSEPASLPRILVA